ncbi:hypothetical protein, partial [Helicobacter pylori]|uniref:hypothetical protein n=1 Tax=Helicobacter pylori TaxID=210 RepID=UPI002928A5F7
SQFESVGVSRSCFCASKIKQDSANLVPAKKLLKLKSQICSASCALFLLHVLTTMLFLHVLLACARVRDWGLE